MRHLNDGNLLGDYVGVIEPVTVPRISDAGSAYYNAHLPDGFFIQAVRNNNDSVSRYAAATFRVAIHERESWIKGERDHPLLAHRRRPRVLPYPRATAASTTA